MMTPMNRNRLLFIQIQTLPPSMHHKWKKLSIFYANEPVENHKGPMPDEKVH
jgi:hypothetical protein